MRVMILKNRFAVTVLMLFITFRATGAYLYIERRYAEFVEFNEMFLAVVELVEHLIETQGEVDETHENVGKLAVAFNSIVKAVRSVVSRIRGHRQVWHYGFSASRIRHDHHKEGGDPAMWEPANMPRGLKTAPAF